ncbi:hypothetical protein TNCV_1480701 [Trichonephila clavipes]|nr:hypothetical protein TNCV_1480701 [Trichonephila clavipes]
MIRVINGEALYGGRTGGGYVHCLIPPHAYTMGVKYMSGWILTSETVGSNLKSETQTGAKLSGCDSELVASEFPQSRMGVSQCSFGLEIHQNDHQARRRFVERAQNEIAVVPDFHKRILFSDEVHFWLNGYVNKQHCRIWSEANSQVYVETPLH